MSKISYSVVLGIHSLGGAVTFTVLYVLFFAFFIHKSITHPTYVHYALTFFCAIRITGFIIRSVLAGLKTGDHLGVVVAYEILSPIGFAGLLSAAYILVLDRKLLSDLRPTSHPRLLRFAEKLFHSFLTTAAVEGIVAATRTTSSGPANTADARGLRIASATMFLFLTVVQALQTGILATASISGGSAQSKDSLGIRYGKYILLLISLLLIIRECFSAGTATHTAKNNNEHFWYPFIALPEIIVVLLNTTPGLVPRRAELRGYKPECTTSSAA